MFDKAKWQREYSKTKKGIEGKKKYYQNNKEKIKQANKRWVDKNADRYKEYRKEYGKSIANKKSQKKYYLANKEKVQLVNKEWRENNKDKYSEYQREYSKSDARKVSLKKYYNKNKGKIKIYGRQRYLKDKGKMQAASKRWAEKNKEKAQEIKRRYYKSDKCRETNKRYSQSETGKWVRRAIMHNRRTSMKGLTKAIIDQVYSENFLRYGELTCYLCLNPIVKGLDSLEHKVPLSRGGTNERDNLDVACRSCNSKKGTKTLEEYKWQ